jgi:hypothetical protein
MSKNGQMSISKIEAIFKQIANRMVHQPQDVKAIAIGMLIVCLAGAIAVDGSFAVIGVSLAAVILVSDPSK